MKKFLPVMFLLAFVVIIFKPFFFEGKLPIPSDTIVGLYHPWRDLYPTDQPFKNFLITDPVRQQYPWRNLSLDILKTGLKPLWNPYSFSGTLLLANLQSATFYPLNFLIFIFGLPIGWSILIVLQILLGGIFMWLYLRNLRLHSLAQTLGILTWVGSGFWVSWLEWNTLIQTVLWLPILLLAVDKIFLSRKKILWVSIFTLALSSSFFAGHLQTFFYTALFSLIYFLSRLFSTKKYSVILWFFVPCLLVISITSLQWWPFSKFLILSARDTDLTVLTRPDWFIPWQNLAQFIAPDYFGNPATLNYFGVWNYGEFLGYVGIVGGLFALVSFFRRDKKTLFYVSVLILSLLFALPTINAKIPFIFKFPLISSSQPSRLLVVTDFCLATLSALGLDYFLTNKNLFKKALIPVTTFLILISILWFFSVGQTVSRHNLILPTILIGISSILFLVASKIKNFQKVIIFLLLLVTVFDLSRVYTKFESFSANESLFPYTKTTEFLHDKSKSEVFRVAALDDRILPPNFAVMYKIQTVSGYDPLFLRRYGEFIASVESDKSQVDSPLNFNRIITPKNYLNPAFSLLNVKYFLSLSDINRKDFSLVFQEGQTRVYENKNLLPRTFFVEQVASTRSKQETMTNLLRFSRFDKLAFVEGFEGLFSPGEAKITNYSENKIEIETKNSGQGFLVLLDSYYPEWKATVDGKPTNIFLTNYTFRGIIVPKGNHVIIFEI